MTRREGQGGFNYFESVPEGMQGTCTITHELTYDGTLIPTWASVLLPACGWVNSAGVFSPVSQGAGVGGVKTITLGHYHDGKLRQLVGAVGTFVITCPTGKGAMITFTFTGKYSANETDTALIAPTYPTAPVLRFADGTVTWNSVGICTSSVGIDAGNAVIMRECAQAGNVTGFISAMITNRTPIITADPEAVLVATQDRDTQWKDMAAGVFAVTLNGTGTSTLVISAPQAQLENKQHGNRNDLITDDLTWLATQGATADSELTITFTATS